MADMSQAKIDLTFKYPFFSSILMRREIRERNDIPTMCVTNDGRIYFNPEFIKGLSHQELVFVLAHEVMHVVCMHGIRRGNRDAKLWNIAGDYYINSFLDTSGVGQRPKGALYKAGCENRTTEEIYSQLLQQKQNQQPQQGQGAQGQEGDDRDQGGGMSTDNQDDGMSTDNQGDPLGDDLKNEGGVTEAEKSEIEARTKLEVAGAVKAAKSRGLCQGALARMVEEMLSTKTPWYEILSRYFAGFTSQKQSWSRPNRRFTSVDKYLPSLDSDISMGEVVVGIDTSGSISNRELQYFCGHLNTILEQCRPSKVHVVYCDSVVSHVDEFEPDDYPIKLECHGGGGTDMTEIVRWVEDQDIEPDVIVILTDGFTPSDCDPPCPLVWATTGSENLENGEVIKIDPEE